MQYEKKKEEKNLAKIEKAPPAIPNEKLQAVVDLADDQTEWLKTVEGGFKLVNQDKFIKSITGRIISVDPYLMKFENGVPTKIAHIADEHQIPEGFERRCDLKIKVGNQILGLSLPSSSFRYYLSPYIKSLLNRGLRPEQVTTRVFSRQASNAKGSWAVSCFEMVGSDQPQEGSSKLPAEWAAE